MTAYVTLSSRVSVTMQTAIKIGCDSGMSNNMPCIIASPLQKRKYLYLAFQKQHDITPNT